MLREPSLTCLFLSQKSTLGTPPFSSMYHVVPVMIYTQVDDVLHSLGYFLVEFLSFLLNYLSLWAQLFGKLVFMLIQTIPTKVRLHVS